MNQFNWDQAFTLDFDLNNGLSSRRYYKALSFPDENMYQDQRNC